MEFKLMVLALGGLGGAGYGVRAYLHGADPAVKAERLASDGRLRDALVELRNASRANRKDAELHVRTALLQSKLARAAGQRPGDRNIQFHLAVALSDDGRPGEAMAVL